MRKFRHPPLSAIQTCGLRLVCFKTNLLSSPVASNFPSADGGDTTLDLRNINPASVVGPQSLGDADRLGAEA